MTGTVASLARFVPAALQRGADALVSTVFAVDSLVNRRLTIPWSGWTSACDPSSAPSGTREGAGSAAWHDPVLSARMGMPVTVDPTLPSGEVLILSWGDES